MKQNMKQTMKPFVILATIMTICGAMILTSCSEGDDALVVTDDKPWTISADDMDPSVRPGDDFFMYCNGGYWQSTSVREDTAMIVSFLRTDVLNDLKKKLADLALPSLEVLKSDEEAAWDLLMDDPKDGKFWQAKFDFQVNDMSIDEATANAGITVDEYMHFFHPDRKID